MFGFECAGKLVKVRSIKLRERIADLRIFELQNLISILHRFIDFLSVDDN